MKTLYLVIANQIPVLTFDTKEAAEQFCKSKPHMQYREFTIPDPDASSEEITASLKDLYALKQTLNGATATLNPGLDAIIGNRLEMHRKFLKGLYDQHDPQRRAETHLGTEALVPLPAPKP